MKIKLYSIFTDSHKSLMKEFLNSYPFEDGIDLNIRHIPQECESGEFNSDGFQNTTKRKIEYFVDCIKELQDEDIMIFADADIIFIKPIKDFILNQIKGVDLIFQSDWGTACTGFFACKVNSNVRVLFDKLLLEADKWYDQDAMNYLLKNFNFNLKVKLLPSEIYNYGFTGKHYKGEDNIKFPDNIILLHANFAVGLNHKHKLINMAKKQFNL